MINLHILWTIFCLLDPNSTIMDPDSVSLLGITKFAYYRQCRSMKHSSCLPLCTVLWMLLSCYKHEWQVLAKLGVSDMVLLSGFWYTMVGMIPYRTSLELHCMKMLSWMERSNFKDDLVILQTVLRIGITLVRIRILLVTLMLIWIRILLVTSIRIRKLPCNLMRIQIQVLASQFKAKTLKKCSNRFIFHTFWLVICKLVRQLIIDTNPDSTFQFDVNPDPDPSFQFYAHPDPQHWLQMHAQLFLSS